MSVIERAASWTTRQLQKRAPDREANAFLTGPFAPVTQERTETGLRVSGTLPPELDGTYARIGPNPIAPANASLYHWFVGDGMVHGVRLRDGAAQWYRNRYVQSPTVSRLLGRPPIPGPRRGVADAVNTNVIAHAGRMWALTEAGVNPIELDSELESRRHAFFASDLSHAYTAHPHRDPQTRELHAVCYDATRERELSYVVVDAAARVTKMETIAVEDGPMVHDCAITQKYVIVLDLPVTLSRREFFAGSSFPYHWNDAHEARVGLLPRGGSGSDVRWFAVDPCYAYHTCNAFEDDAGRVSLDLVVHPKMFDRSRQGPDSQSTTFERWTIDPSQTRVRRTVISDHRQEFPRYDERLTMRPHRYCYAVGARVETDGEPLLRHDMQTGQTLVHDFGPGRIAGEPVFVPRAPDSAEDDGWLLTFVYDLATERSDLVVVNAGDVGGEPQATVHLPVRVPLGFHGNWMPSEP